MVWHAMAWHGILSLPSPSLSSLSLYLFFLLEKRQIKYDKMLETLEKQLGEIKGNQGSKAVRFGSTETVEINGNPIVNHSQRASFEVPKVGDLIVPTIAYCTSLGIPVQPLRVGTIFEDGSFMIDVTDPMEGNYSTTCELADIERVFN